MRVQAGSAILMLVLCAALSKSNADVRNYTYTYDDLNRLTRMLDSCGNQIEYAYDDAGNLMNRTISQGSDCPQMPEGESYAIQSPNPVTGDRLGYSVSVAGNFAVVGSRLADAGGLSNSGTVEVFKRDADGAWPHHQTIISNNVGANHHFGHAVAISGDYLIVGEETDNTIAFRAGSASLYTKNAQDEWVYSSITVRSWASRDYFGRSVAIDGNSFAVGVLNADNYGSNSGHALVYDFDSTGSSITHLMELIPNDGDAGDRFGVSIGLSGDYAIVGAFRDDDSANSTGSAYVFHRNHGGINLWGQVAKLVAPNPVANDQFGYSVSISDDTIAIGSRLSDSATANQIGAVFVYRGADSTGDGILDDWSDVTQLAANDAVAGDRFGTSVAIDGDHLIVGAPARDEFGDSSGIAYYFKRNAAGLWTQEKRLFDSNSTSTRDQFGISVAVDDANRLGLVGAWLDNVPGANNSGRAYLFDLF